MSTVHDERRFAPAVREYVSGNRLRVRDRDRTALARTMYSNGRANWQIAEILGVHWAQIDDVLAGKPVR